MKPDRMHRRYQFVSRFAAGDTEKEGPAGQRGSLFKGSDAAERLPGFIPPGEGRRGGSASANASEWEGPAWQGPSGGGRCNATSSHRGAVRRFCSPPARRAGASVARSAPCALTRVPRLARPATLARPRGGIVRHSKWIRQASSEHPCRTSPWISRFTWDIRVG